MTRLSTRDYELSSFLGLPVRGLPNTEVSVADTVIFFGTPAYQFQVKKDSSPSQEVFDSLRAGDLQSCFADM